MRVAYLVKGLQLLLTLVALYNFLAVDKICSIHEEVCGSAAEQRVESIVDEKLNRPKRGNPNWAAPVVIPSNKISDDVVTSSEEPHTSEATTTEAAAETTTVQTTTEGNATSSSYSTSTSPPTETTEEATTTLEPLVETTPKGGEEITTVLPTDEASTTTAVVNSSAETLQIESNEQSNPRPEPLVKGLVPYSYSCFNVSSKALFGLTGDAAADNVYFEHIKGIVLVGPSIALAFILIALGVGKLVAREPASKTTFIVNVLSVVLWTIVAISIIFVYAQWDKSWEEDAKNGFSPVFPCKWLCVLIIAIQMLLLVALEAYAANSMQHDIVVERAYGSYEVVGNPGLSNSVAYGRLTL